MPLLFFADADAIIFTGFRHAMLAADVATSAIAAFSPCRAFLPRLFRLMMMLSYDDAAAAASRGDAISPHAAAYAFLTADALAISLIRHLRYERCHYFRARLLLRAHMLSMRLFAFSCCC